MCLGSGNPYGEEATTAKRLYPLTSPEYAGLANPFDTEYASKNNSFNVDGVNRNYPIPPEYSPSGASPGVPGAKERTHSSSEI